MQGRRRSGSRGGEEHKTPRTGIGAGEARHWEGKAAARENVLLEWEESSGEEHRHGLGLGSTREGRAAFPRVQGGLGLRPTRGNWEFGIGIDEKKGEGKAAVGVEGQRQNEEKDASKKEERKKGCVWWVEGDPGSTRIIGGEGEGRSRTRPGIDAKRDRVGGLRPTRGGPGCIWIYDVWCVHGMTQQRREAVEEKGDLH